MKRYQLILGSFALVLASCETGEIVTGGDFDPLTAPGSGRATVAAVRGFKAGSFVHSSMDNTAFFNKRPKGDAEADKLLAANTSMKVIADDGSYVKVELDSGEVGFVNSVQVTDQSGAGPSPLVSPDAIQVYPPLPGTLDPNVPTIPPVIDPEAPMIQEEPLIPDAPPIPGEAAPVVPPVEPTPLPPGNETEGDPPVEKSNF